MMRSLESTQTLPEFGVAELLATAEKGWEIVAQPYEAITHCRLQAVEAPPLNYHGGAFNYGPRTGGPKREISQRSEAGGAAVHRALRCPVLA
jgi:hypothetical protein